jgi:hypothetical protein
MLKVLKCSASIADPIIGVMTTVMFARTLETVQHPTWFSPKCLTTKT